MTAPSLTEFLLARIAEDEGTALYAQTRDDVQPEDWGGWWFGHYQHYSRYDPARVLADVESKRRIVHQHGDGPEPVAHECPDGFMDAAETDPHTGFMVNCPTLRLLALPYADHPDYQEAWKP